MAHRNLGEMVLTTGQLNEMDVAVLDLLHEGRVTPALARAQLAEQWDEDDDIPRRQYINQRLTRLSEHGHVRNLQKKGVYELVNDPRTDGEQSVAERYSAVTDCSHDFYSGSSQVTFVNGVSLTVESDEPGVSVELTHPQRATEEWTDESLDRTPAEVLMEILADYYNASGEERATKVPRLDAFMQEVANHE
jgi:hypothetical protein